MPISVGMTITVDTIVDTTNMASSVGSGKVDVFATPMMLALMERAASDCIADFLEAGQVSVGNHVDIVHTAATPFGMKVSATATVIAIDRRRIDFKVVANDEAGEIGRGTHSRFIVDKKSFEEKTRQRRG